MNINVVPDRDKVYKKYADIKELAFTTYDVSGLPYYSSFFERQWSHSMR